MVIISYASRKFLRNSTSKQVLGYFTFLSFFSFESVLLQPSTYKFLDTNPNLLIIYRPHNRESNLHSYGISTSGIFQGIRQYFHRFFSTSAQTHVYNQRPSRDSTFDKIQGTPLIVHYIIMYKLSVYTWGCYIASSCMNFFSCYHYQLQCFLNLLIFYV